MPCCRCRPPPDRPRRQEHFMPEKRQLCSPDWALFMAYRYQDRGRDFGQPEFMEWGLQIEAVARAAMRMGLKAMPWIPRQTLWQPRPAPDRPAIMPGRQMD